MSDYLSDQNESMTLSKLIVYAPLHIDSRTTNDQSKKRVLDLVVSLYDNQYTMLDWVSALETNLVSITLIDEQMSSQLEITIKLLKAYYERENA